MMTDKPFNPLTDIDGTPPTLWERIGYWFTRRKILRSVYDGPWCMWFSAPKWLFKNKYYNGKSCNEDKK